MARTVDWSVPKLLDEYRLSGVAAGASSGLQRSTLLALLVMGAALAAWATLAPIGGAVVAQGVVKTELNRKVIQHQEGGLVSKVLVRDGQHVQAGDVLAVIADMRSDANLDLLRGQHASELLRRARLEAEVDGSSGFQVPQSLRSSPLLADMLPRERKVFAARRATLGEQLAALSAQSRETSVQVDALQSQIVATQQALKLAGEELKVNAQLAEQGFVQRTRLIGLERVVAEYDARLGQQRGDLAEARQKIEDLRLRGVQARSSYQQQASEELKDSTLRLRESDERLRPSADLAERQTVKAPQGGTIMGLRLGAVGSAVGPRETLMELVPDDERLIVEAHIRPEDVDHVHVGGQGEVRLSAFEARISPHLSAQVVFVSPDRVVEPQTGNSWYTAHLAVDEAQLRRFPQLRMQTGMPAEVFVATPARSLLRYLIEPIDVFRQRALREP